MGLRQAAPTEHEEKDQRKIRRNEKHRKERGRRGKEGEREKADGVFGGGEDEEAHRLFVRPQVCLSECRGESEGIRTGHYNDCSKGVIRYSPQNDTENCSPKTKPIERGYISVAF